MFGISFAELVVIAFVALLIIGPDELPAILKKFGKIVGRIKVMGAEFMGAINDEVEQPKKYIKDLHGNLQETYDIEDLIKKKKGDE